MVLRHIRACTGQPVHITRISDAELLKQHNQQEPIQTLLQMLQREKEREQDRQLEERLFPGRWREDVASKLQALRHGIAAVDVGVTITCQTCGVAFGSRKAMLIHAAKAHGNQPAKQTFHREEHSTQGLPICRYCSTKFTRWDGLRAHIEKQRCPKMQYVGEVKSASLHEVPKPSAMASSGQAMQTLWEEQVHPDQASNALANLSEIMAPTMLPAQAAEPSLPSSMFRRVLNELPGARIDEIYRADPELRHRLKQECGICGQWIASTKSMKQHYRHSHKNLWDMHATQAQAFCKAFTALGNPCYMCGSTSRDKKHIQRCTVLFQHCFIHNIRGAEHNGGGAVQRDVWGPATSAGSGVQHEGGAATQNTEAQPRQRGRETKRAKHQERDASQKGGYRGTHTITDQIGDQARGQHPDPTHESRMGVVHEQQHPQPLAEDTLQRGSKLEVRDPKRNVE